MAKVNTHFFSLSPSYVFSWVEERIALFKKKYPDRKLINLGIGDVALPLSPTVGAAIREAILEMEKQSGLRGYGPSNGYDFLRKAIVEAFYSKLSIDESEIFISDGINSDIVNILELFSPRNRIGIPNPSYPPYRNASILSGRGPHLMELPCYSENGFMPMPPQKPCDLIFLCSPHNPTGGCFSKKQLEEWVCYAKQHNAIIFYDSAYSAFISSDKPRSIFEIEGAREVAIEFCSFSKSAGFTGLRCAFAVLPKVLKAKRGKQSVALHSFWKRRQDIKFNGVAYPIQKGALASLIGKGKEEVEAQVALYCQNAKELLQSLKNQELKVCGGEDSPYIWWEGSQSCWDFFEKLLEDHGLVSVPGEGFGTAGKNAIRLSAFAKAESIAESKACLSSIS
jgi:LL-diaminopimelate aminotransferase